MKFFLSILAIGLSACVGPAHDVAESVAPLCPGFQGHNQCEPWARAFQKQMADQGHAVTLVGYRWSYRGETVDHIAAFWKDTDGWWARDNIHGPVQVDSFSRYDWKTRVENFVYPMQEAEREVMPSGDYHIANIRIVSRE